MERCDSMPCRLNWLRGFYILAFFLVAGHSVMAATPEEQAQERASRLASLATSLASGQTFTFAYDKNAIVIEQQNLTLQGPASGDFSTKIGSLSRLVGGRGSGVTLDIFKGVVDGWKSETSYAAGIARGYLSGIEGSGGTRTRLIPGNTDDDPNKWLTTRQQLGDSTANGLSLKDLRFGNVDVQYGVGESDARHVNGLIGNDNLTNGLTTMGSITGNVFNKIGVTLRHNNDTFYLAGGGVVGVRSTAGSAEIAEVSGNIFDDIDILTTNGADAPAGVNFNGDSTYLEGGGLVGVNGVSSPDDVVGHASLGVLSNNYFTNINIGSNDILLGGGLVGVNNNSKDGTISTFARLGTARGNVFGSGAANDITITLDDSLRGGGVIGVNGLSSAAAQLGSLENNAFAGITMATGSYIKGGGIVGLQTNDGGIPDSERPGNDHDLNGDDMVPAMATLGTASGNLFLNQTVTAGSFIEGGGIIGLRSNNGVAELGTLTGNIFKGIKVNSGEAETISGGGVVGLSAATQALMGEGGGVKNNIFDDIHVTAGILDNDPDPDFIGNSLNGGGIIGVHARNGSNHADNWATLQGVENNSFTRSNVTAASIYGGGIVGVNAGGAPKDNEFRAGLAAIGKVNDNTFADLEITTVSSGDGTGALEGGGVIGVWNNDDISGIGQSGVSAIDEVNRSVFTNIKVNAGYYLQGGGIIGIRGSSLEQMGSLTENIFSGNTITAGNGGYIDGGGIIGVTARDGDKPYSGIKLIGDSLFTGNKVIADGDVLGGLVYSFGLTNVTPDNEPNSIGMTIRNSQFIGNKFTSGGTVYGAVTVDTGTAPLSLTSDTTLTLTADPGKSTVFMNNSITDANPDNARLLNRDRTRTNSLYFGTIHEPGPNGDDDPAEWNPTLNVNPLAGGVVALYDPIWVNQADPVGDDDDTDHGFDMNVRGAGDFIWGGKNVFTLDAADAAANDDGTSGAVTLEAGSTTTLLDGSSTTTFVNGGLISGSHVKTMELDAPNFRFDLATGATLNVEGHNRFDLSAVAGTDFAGPNDPRGDTVANLKGNLHFNLNNTEVYRRGETPGDGSHPFADVDSRLAAGYTPLLTIATPDDAPGMVDLKGSTVTLGDFRAERPLVDGDRFYLVELDGPTVEGPDPVANPGDKGFVDNDARYGVDTTPGSATASAAAGFAIKYDFIVDKNYDNLNKEENTRFLVARLAGMRPGDGTPPLGNSRVTTVTVLQRGSDWLTGFPLYDFDPDPVLCPVPEPVCALPDPCTPYDPCDACASARRVPHAPARPTGWFWSSFADAKGTLYRVEPDAASHSDIRGAFALAGVAAHKWLGDGGISLGAFADVGITRYDTSDTLQDARVIRGDGDHNTAGGGVLLRRKWDSGFHLDGMARVGHSKNRFSSDDITFIGTPLYAELTNAYFGADVGLGYEWRRERSAFDVYGRYSWLMDGGDTTSLSSGEIVDFAATHSHRAIVGGRWTWDWNPDVSSYVGAAYEHEFDSDMRAVERSSGHNLEFKGMNVRGGTAIGEIGVHWRRSENFALTFGLEGFLGQRSGGSGFISAVWRW